MLAKKGLMTAPAAVAQYVEDVFSTYLYTGNDTARSITNGIDLSGEGGLVWIKSRSNTFSHRLTDTVRGATKSLLSNTTGAETTETTALTAFNADGFSIGINGSVNDNTTTFASWTFRKAEKFFDVVTYTGTGVNGRTVAHNLGSVPGVIIVKQTSASGEPWRVYHRSLGASARLDLNTTDAATTGNDEPWYNTSPTSTHFTVAYNSANKSGETYVAYLFAHDAGGFGDAGDQSVISCGSFTTDSGEASTTTLGWEPQWLLIKKTSAAQDWYLADNMRGLNVAGQDDYFLYPNLSSAEGNNNRIGLTATGFTTSGFGASSTFVYIAIRRGPMKTPELGTDVYKPVTYTGNGSTQTLTTGFPVDMFWNKTRVAGPGSTMDRMRNQNVLRTEDTNSESAIGTYGSTTNVWQNNTGLSFGSGGADGLNESAKSVGLQAFRRAPGFFDVVCYTGTGSAGATTSHNLGVAPELIITRIRNYTGEDWIVHYRNGSTIRGGYLNSTAALTASGSAPSTDLTNFTSTSYERNTGNRRVNGTYNYVAYLFASVAGVSKIGTVNVTGSTVNVDCGFTSGARFVMMKRIENTSPWLVWDTARGIVAGNDPYLKINSTQAEDFDGAADFIDPLSSGFTIAAGGVDGYFGSGDYVYLAIA